MINVLSLFDGMSCGQIALDRLGVKVGNYYASEIDKYAIQIAKKNFPNTIELGDVTQVKGAELPKIDLLIGGSPCQGFSFAGKQLNFDDPRSKLFFEFVRLLREVKPKYFLLENVKMKKEYQDVISEILGVGPVEINSNLVSAQNRKRLYWTNIEGVTQPEDKGILLEAILVSDGEPICYSSSGRGGGKVEARLSSNKKAHTLTKTGYSNGAFTGVTEDKPLILQKPRGSNKGGIRAENGKVPSLTSSSWQHNNHLVVRDKSKCVRSGGRGSYDRHEWDSISNCHYRKLTVIECERLQTVPDNYTEGVSNSQRYKMLGNGWTIDVITHILRGIK